MGHLVIHTTQDVLTTAPILLVVYLLIGWLENSVNSHNLHRATFGPLGPLVGAVIGSVPQCGFAAASAAFFNSGLLGGGALIAVFLATSDEAIPLLLTQPDQAGTILALILWKIAIAVFWGYFFALTLYRQPLTTPAAKFTLDAGRQRDMAAAKSYPLLREAVSHTLTVTLFLFMSLLLLNGVIEALGQARLQTLLLSHSLWQPAATALLGLVPGCATSVLITQLYLSGVISFGAAIAGLSSGAGLGYLVLFRPAAHRRQALLILLCTYCAAALSGLAVQLLSQM